MLKTALAAGGAITAAAFLDGKWLKPVVKTGILPVHAQASVPFAYFYPVIQDNNPFDVSGTAVLYGAVALDKVTSNPTPADLLVVSGPISYNILSYTGFGSLVPLAGHSGTMTDGYWPASLGTPGLPPIIETFTYFNVTTVATVTVQWSFNGFLYVYTYNIDWAP